MDSPEVDTKQLLSHWILSDSVNIPDFHLAYGTLPDGTIEPQIPNIFLPGGERWAGFGLKYGILSFKNARELISPFQFAKEFKSLQNKNVMDKIWTHITDLNARNRSLITSKDPKKKNLIVWMPGSMFTDPIKRIYFIYHPLIFETIEKNYNDLNSWLLLGYISKYDSNNINKDWTSLPTIDFLPNDKSIYNIRIIAGSAGLLVIDGGQQRHCQGLHLLGETNDLNETYWKYSNVYMNYQSIVFVANPLTKEYIMLPPIPNRVMNQKKGKFIWRNKERTSYILILIGYDIKVESDYKLQKLEKITKYTNFDYKHKIKETIGLFVYSSQEKCYIYCDEIESRQSLLNYTKNSCIAMIGYKIFVGGMMVTQNSKSLKVESPCLYYFNISNSTCTKKLIIPFVLKGISYATSLQAPKLVQGSSKQIFAITYTKNVAVTLYIIEIFIKEHKEDFWEFKLVATMPENLFHKLFSKSTCIDNYEVSGCNNIISFKLGGKSIIVIQYHIKNLQWSTTYIPKQKPSNVASYHLVDAAYEPYFHARP